jgi:circadian clock protein KaiB
MTATNARIDPAERWILFLYVAGMTPAAKRALSNIQALCEEHLKGQYTLEVIDLLERPALAEGHQIFAVPTLVRQLPEPLRKIVGDLADVEKVLVGLDIRTAIVR